MKLYVANRWAVVLEISFSWTQVYGWSKPRLNIICGGDLSASRPWSSYWHHLNSACSSIVVVVQSLSHVWLFATPGTAALQASLSFTISQSLLKLTSIESMMPSNHLILCHPFSSCPQSFPVSRSFPTNQLFASGGQSIGVSALASALPVNIPDWFPLRLTSLISLQSKGRSRVFSNTTVQKHQFFSIQLSLWSNSHIHTWLLEKP